MNGVRSLPIDGLGASMLSQILISDQSDHWDAVRYHRKSAAIRPIAMDSLQTIFRWLLQLFALPSTEPM